MWGKYAPAIARWECITGYPAPAPTVLMPSGKHRLSPKLVEWLMDAPPGHVTDVPGLSRNAQFRALGNGVVFRQATYALRVLLSNGPTTIPA